MDTFLKIFIVVVLALAFIGWLADRRAAAKRPDVTPTFPSARRYQVRKSEWKCSRLFPYRDIDHPLDCAYLDPSPIQLSATDIANDRHPGDRVVSTIAVGRIRSSPRRSVQWPGGITVSHRVAAASNGTCPPNMRWLSAMLQRHIYVASSYEKLADVIRWNRGSPKGSRDQ
jgi:hypothetical protein